MITRNGQTASRNLRMKLIERMENIFHNIISEKDVKSCKDDIEMKL